MKELNLQAGEWMLIGAGVLFLISTVFLASGGSFSVWFAAKLLYLLGVVLFLLNR